MSKILIIEDEEAIADLEKDYLELSGFEVEIEHRGDVGLKRALTEDFNLVILDLMLPEMNGFDICREIRAQKNTPIIMVSAKKDDIDKIRGLGLGADVLVHESTYGKGDEKIAKSHGHSTNMQAAQVARDASAKRLLLNHVSARFLGRDIGKMAADAKTIFENTHIVRDLEEVEI